MIQKNNIYIFLLVLGGGQDKQAWTACPPGVKITRVGGKISRDSLPPGGQANRGWLAPRGASCPGGKINWDTGKSFPTPLLRRNMQLAKCFLNLDFSLGQDNHECSDTVQE